MTDSCGGHIPVETVLQEIYAHLDSIFLATLAKSYTKSCTYLASLTLKMNLFLQDINELRRSLQEKCKIIILQGFDQRTLARKLPYNFILLQKLHF